MQLRLRSPAGGMEEATPGCPLLRCRPCARPALWSLAILVALLGGVAFSLSRGWQPPEPPARDIAELQLNHTAPRRDARLCWQGDPALGRSFTHGPQLVAGQLQIRREGVYWLHIQVTLSNCSTASQPARGPGASLTVGVRSPGGPAISLLRLHFDRGCSVASQRLAPLAAGATLDTNLTLSLLPSPNADETFFGIQWVSPFPLHLPA